MIYVIIIIFLAASYVFIFLFYLYGWIITITYKITLEKPVTNVSVIIPARNEEKNIGNLLSGLLKQTYPSSLTEIIVADDFSEDRTAEIVSSFNHASVRLVRMSDSGLSKNESSKKKALETSIRQSKGDLIVTTDADCTMNENWLSTLVNFYEEKKCHMIVSPVIIRNERNFFQKFQALDFTGLIGITAATLRLNFPTMCNGANLAFRRTSFDEVNGYEGIDEASSGDDMLLMHKMARRWKNGVQFLRNSDGVVYTESQPTVSAFIRQRMRWTSKSAAYSDWKIQANLLTVYLFNLSIFVSAVALFFRKEFLIILLFQLLTKFILDFAFLLLVTNFFNNRKLMRLFLAAEILHIAYITWVGFAGNFFRTKWKGRQVK